MKIPAFLVAFLALAVAACSGTPAHGPHDTEKARQPIEIRPGFFRGYLDDAELPNSLALVPPAPVAGSPTQAADNTVSAAAYALRGTPRWRLASSDADLRFPHAAGLFACALGTDISADAMPATYRLLQRSLADAARSNHSAKDHYKRPRPFVLDQQATCTPDDETHMHDDGAYPSGHAVIGWTWASILAEADPARADAIFQRGRSLGESRLVCHVHWNSDVVEARVVADAVVARLQDNAEFQSDLATARRELAAAQAKGLAPKQDCKAEADTLARTVPGAL